MEDGVDGIVLNALCWDPRALVGIRQTRSMSDKGIDDGVLDPNEPEGAHGVISYLVGGEVLVCEEVEDGVDGIVLDTLGRDPRALVGICQTRRAQLPGLCKQILI